MMLDEPMIIEALLMMHPKLQDCRLEIGRI